MRLRVTRGASWLASNAVEIVFIVLVVGAFAYSLRITRQAFFFADEWRVIRQAGSFTGMFDQYNHSLSVVTMILDRSLVELFGFTYTPFRVVGLACLFAVPLTYFLTTRRQFGAVLAAFLGFPLLWYGRYVSLDPSEHNHNLALLGGIGCAAALNRGRRADGVLAAALTLSLCSAGGGVAVAAACLVHNACTRAHFRRWLAVLGPSAAWFAWWLIVVGKSPDLGPLALTTSQTIKFIRGLAFTPFVSAGLGNEWLGYVLLGAFVIVGIRMVSKGLDAGANFLAWSIGVLVWALGLATSRGVLANTATFRYRYGALALVLLAVVPRRPIRWPRRFPIATDRRYVLAGACAVLLLGGARGLAVRSDLQAYAAQQAGFGRAARGETLVLGLGPTVVGDDVVLSFGFGGLRAGALRSLLSEYHNPLATSRATIDHKLVDLGLVLSRPDGTRDNACKQLTKPFTYQPPGGISSLFLWSRDYPFVVDVRRFGRDWVRLDHARPGEALRIELPGFGGVAASEPWQVRADSACRVGPRSG